MPVTVKLIEAIVMFCPTGFFFPKKRSAVSLVNTTVCVRLQTNLILNEIRRFYKNLCLQKLLLQIVFYYCLSLRYWKDERYCSFL